MKCDFILTSEQQALVENNLSVIDKAINLFINPDEDVCDLGRSDLYQEGAVALCKAAVTYDGKSAQFSTYATTVVRNHLYNCCKAANTRQRKLPAVSLDMDFSEEDGPPRSGSRPSRTGWTNCWAGWTPPPCWRTASGGTPAWPGWAWRRWN